MLTIPGILSQNRDTGLGTYDELVISHNPRMYFRFNEPVGATQVIDYSGNGFHVTPGSAIQFQQPDIVNNRGVGCAYFPSTSTSTLSTERIVVPWQMTTSTTFCIEFWVKVDTKAGDNNRGLFGFNTLTPNRTWGNFTLSGHNTAIPELNFHADTGSSFTRWFPVVAWNSNNVYHIVLLLANSTAKLYINNVLYNLAITWGTNRTDAINRLITSASQEDRPTWYIGQGYNTARNFGGYLSDFAIYTYWLSEEQIAEHYVKGLLV